jgi:hypothetical protein
MACKLTSPRFSHDKKAKFSMDVLFNDPSWKSIYARIAIILLVLLMGPLNILHMVVELLFPGFIGLSSIACLSLLAVALVLIAIAYFKDFRHMKPGEREC